MLMRRDQKPSRKELPIIQLFPNAITLGAICAGLTAIRLAALGSIELAVSLIILACVLDGVDGRLARALGSESLLGAELDSLADFLNFGVAPALIIYFWAFATAPDIGWAAVLIYALCCVMRLARFNVGAKSESGNDPQFFQGVPSPAGGLLALAPLFFSNAFPGLPPIPPTLVAFYLALVGGLMISRLPTFSLKTARIYADHAPYVLLAAAGGLTALAVLPWITLALFDTVYLISLGFAYRASHKLPKQPEV
jgi:CDP-diacylglycerol--serine O-phosphatidyltransferase